MEIDCILNNESLILFYLNGVDVVFSVHIDTGKRRILLLCMDIVIYNCSKRSCSNMNTGDLSV
jgi:hypothetical protein